jgi:hypothetical protein
MDEEIRKKILTLLDQHLCVPKTLSVLIGGESPNVSAQ